MVYNNRRNRRRRARAHQKATAAPPACPLLDKLPQEIRDHILELLLQARSRFEIYVAVGTRFGLNHTGMDVEVWNTFSCLNATCHQLREDATMTLTRINTFHIICRPSFADKLYSVDSTEPLWVSQAITDCPLVPFPERVLENLQHIMIEAQRPMKSFFKGPYRVPLLSCHLLIERLESKCEAHFTKRPKLDRLSRLLSVIKNVTGIEQPVGNFVRSAPAAIEQLLNTSPLGFRTLQQVVQIMVYMGLAPDDTFHGPCSRRDELSDREYVRQTGFGSLRSFNITGSRSIQQQIPSYEWLYNTGEDRSG